MSKTSKIVLGVAVLAVLLLGGFYYWQTMQKNAALSGTQGAAEVTTLPSGASTNDAAIEKDLTSVDAQLAGVASDNTDTHTSVSAAAAQ